MSGGVSSIDLPDRPAEQVGRSVAAWQEAVTIDTYRPEAPDRYPAYLDQRVYQGSSGRVYPLPFFERIEARKVPHRWEAVHLENRWIRLMILPELGGRIHIGQDLTTGYDFFYRNNVIKPALIGLTGPWIAGGVEFNWPQHHRPATYLPTDVSIEYEESGAVTVWCSDHDPFTRMKGMHGIRLHPDKAVVEARVRLYNRDEEPRTFLWWANVAARAHADYQSFFSTDVTMVADHAKRAVTAFPAADRPYYDIDYPHRPATPTTSLGTGSEGVPGDRLDWYRNIPVPTSYMCLNSADDFFGGYDHAAGAGFVHVADHQISVGKKQWTWGNAPFGRAWDRNLADDDAAYVELMAGVFTDNQPDFTFIAPGETKVFSQFWYPIQQLGPVQQATVDAAVRIDPTADGARLGVATTGIRPGTVVELRDHDQSVVFSAEVDVEPGAPVFVTAPLPEDVVVADLEIVIHQQGQELLRWQRREGSTDAVAASEPAAPEEVDSVDELYRIGVHLAQYRHATRSPEPYWREALRRDAAHAPSCLELAVAAYRRAQFDEAESLLRTAIGRLTWLNPNPADGTAFYYLGLVLVRQGRTGEAYDAFGKASWNRLWRAPAGFQMACLDAAAGRHRQAADRLEDVVRCEPDHLQARSLQVIQLRHLGRTQEAKAILEAQLTLDPLHWWARDLAGESLTCDAQTCLDIALEYLRVGESYEAQRVLGVAWHSEGSLTLGAPAARPLIGYHQAQLWRRLGHDADADTALAQAAAVSDRYCFPGRLDDVALLQVIIEADGSLARPHALLGHWLYAVGRKTEAAASWRRAVELDPADSVSWRNLGLAAFNVDHDVADARRCYARAVAAAPEEARLWFERDQLHQRAGVAPEERLATLAERHDLIAGRDDATVELSHVLVSLDRAHEAHALLRGRNFQPWEGGEGQTLAAWDRACVTLAREALSEGAADQALSWVDAALEPPLTLGEARHPLANAALLHLVRGDALELAGRLDQAAEEWRLAATEVGDFQSMSSQPYSGATFASIQAHQRLGDEVAAEKMITGVQDFCDQLDHTPATIDYFATSLPSLLLFGEDPQTAQDRRVQFLRSQLDVSWGRTSEAQERLNKILTADPNHRDARDLERFISKSDQKSTTNRA